MVAFESNWTHNSRRLTNENSRLTAVGIIIQTLHLSESSGRPFGYEWGGAVRRSSGRPMIRTRVSTPAVPLSFSVVSDIPVSELAVFFHT